MKKPKFIGLDTEYITADGNRKRRVHMDGAASPLACATALQTMQKLLPHYSNSHSHVHTSAHITTEAFNWAYQTTLNFVGANSEDYAAIFTGSGATAAINRIARGLASARPERKIVLVSAMEHHANDLPHRGFDNQVIYIPVTGSGENSGNIDLSALETLLHKHAQKINYIAVTEVSNVTGFINPITEIARLAHRFDVFVLVDGAQAVAHLPITLSNLNDSSSEIDFYVFSGHKLYTPASPGVLIAKKKLLTTMTGQDLGGGSVSDVSYFDYQLQANLPDREQSGTPNLVGAIALASVMQVMQNFGLNKIQRHNHDLIESLRHALDKLPNVVIYGSSECNRIGAIAFNHLNIDHGLLAAILNDYYAIAVRNECFCAHPYVSSMLKDSLWELDLDEVPEDQQQAFINRKRGMVRVSISLYNTRSDVDYLISSLVDIVNKIDDYTPLYTSFEDGSYKHKKYQLDWKSYLQL